MPRLRCNLAWDLRELENLGLYGKCGDCAANHYLNAGHYLCSAGHYL